MRCANNPLCAIAYRDIFVEKLRWSFCIPSSPNHIDPVRFLRFGPGQCMLLLAEVPKPCIVCTKIRRAMRPKCMAFIDQTSLQWTLPSQANNGKSKFLLIIASFIVDRMACMDKMNEKSTDQWSCLFRGAGHYGYIHLDYYSGRQRCFYLCYHCIYHR